MYFHLKIGSDQKRNKFSFSLNKSYFQEIENIKKQGIKSVFGDVDRLSSDIKIP